MDKIKLCTEILKQVKNGDTEMLEDCFQLIRDIESDAATVNSKVLVEDENFKVAHEFNKKLQHLCIVLLRSGKGDEVVEDIYKRTYLFDAPYDFDSYCIYLEWNREQDKRFYLPRRKQLLPLVNSLQDLETGDLELLSISCPPGIGKTTIAIFYLTWIGGRNPELTILGGSHSNDFLRGVYDEIHRIVDPSDEEYLFQDIFPMATIATTNAKSMRIDLEKPKRFQTFEFSSIGSGNAGKVRASHLLYCDDLVDGIETAMSRDRLDKLYQQYYTDLRQRKIGKARELHIATRWSVHDVIGRLEEQFGEDPHCKFLSFPALDENDESNFDYPYNLGFTTEFYHQQRAIMDDVSWRALYMNVPIEREGQLYVRDELRRYFELPDQEPDAIISVCDTKTTGSDYCVLPIAYKYGNDYYIEDVVCENFAPDVVENSVVNMLLKHQPHYARFESNVAGGKMAQVVQERIKEKGCKTKITTKWTQANKETKIQVESPFVKQHFLFKDDSVIQGEGFKEYRKMLQMLCSYSLEGKNKHDDVPDALAQLSQFTQSFDSGKVVIRKRFF